MFFIGNMQEWLKPMLIEHGYPSWISNSFSFYAIIFVTAGLINTWFVQFFKPKTEDEKELGKLKAKCKRNERDKSSAIKKAVSEKEKTIRSELEQLKIQHREDKKNIAQSHQNDLDALKAKIKAKDAMIESMTDQLAEKFKIIEEYNKEAYSNQNKTTIENKSSLGDNVVPNISHYTD